MDVVESDDRASTLADDSEDASTDDDTSSDNRLCANDAVITAGSIEDAVSVELRLDATLGVTTDASVDAEKEIP